ncbi:MAG TPA: hypothetical protein VK386_08835 [Acidimicrobiales bacterium]|nr:hypothetical protein [Acidimicrobiales bacterium]
MDVLVSDTTTPAAADVARSLLAAGHRVHVCQDDPHDDHCTELTEGACPLDTAPIDVAVAVGDTVGRHLADGALCAARRRIPLVLADAPADHPLRPWATAQSKSADAVATVEAVLARPLRDHTERARQALLQELRRQGSDALAADVTVWRRPGRLQVELDYQQPITRTQAERLVTHVAQAVRQYDRWAPKLDATVRPRST